MGTQVQSKHSYFDLEECCLVAVSNLIYMSCTVHPMQVTSHHPSIYLSISTITSPAGPNVSAIAHCRVVTAVADMSKLAYFRSPFAADPSRGCVNLGQCAVAGFNSGNPTVLTLLDNVKEGRDYVVQGIAVLIPGHKNLTTRHPIAPKHCATYVAPANTHVQINSGQEEWDKRVLFCKVRLGCCRIIVSMQLPVVPVAQSILLVAAVLCHQTCVARDLAKQLETYVKDKDKPGVKVWCSSSV